VPAQDLIVDPATIDFSQVVADIEEIRRWIPQRDAMEQLTAIVLDDVERHVCVGYRDITDQEFWVSGHMPGAPLMPGVLMCEAAAQVLSYHIQRNDLSGASMVGFGGLDGVKFRGPVRPGDRLLIACEITKYRRGRMVVCRFQEFVGATLVSEGEITGIALPDNVIQSTSAGS
jgi:3-hydroxyacyl-[acyl-carrier-protein] dehydratase